MKVPARSPELFVLPDTDLSSLTLVQQTLCRITDWQF